MGALALAGVGVNLLIGNLYGFQGLGAFSQALLFFLILGQTSAGGFAFATLYQLSLSKADTSNMRNYFLAMCLPVLVIGGVQALVLWQGAALIGQVFGSKALAAMLPAVGLGAWFFGINKVGACALNGLSHLKTYALIQGARMPLMLMAVGWLAISDAELADLGWVFVASEVVISGLLLFVLWLYLSAGPVSLAKMSSILVVESGRCWRGSLIGLLSDLNTKIDLLVLSLLASDTIVGIYALGGMFADGLRMVLAAIQNIVNPQVASIVSDGDRRAYDSLFSTLAKFGPVLSSVVLLCGAVVMFYLAPVIFGAEDTSTSLWVFLIIGGSVLVAAPAIILNQTFTQSGHPVLQTKYFTVIASINLLLNFALIPFFGPIGAAVATAAAEICQLFLLRRWSSRLFCTPESLGQ